ncbi:MAG: HAD family hydrolase, partial [Planctomycetaceae bacterium]|nr:HAD family hydrolase [Planctomycetaceae bacterium]
PIVSCNGAQIGFPGEEPLHHLRLDAACRDIIMEAEKEFGFYVNYYIDNAVYTLTDGPDRDIYSAQYSFVALSPDADDIRSRSTPTKCLIISSEADQPRIADMFKERLGDNVVITSSNERFTEIMPLGADKGEGLRFLSEWAAIPMDRFIAVGDALNDLPMLREAGFAISFKSGDPRLVEYVDMLLPPLWEDGIDVLAKCVLDMTNSGRFLTPRSSRFFRNQKS